MKARVKSKQKWLTNKCKNNHVVYWVFTQCVLGWLHIITYFLCWTGYQGDNCELGSLSSSVDIAAGKSNNWHILSGCVTWSLSYFGNVHF